VNYSYIVDEESLLDAYRRALNYCIILPWASRNGRHFEWVHLCDIVWHLGIREPEKIKALYKQLFRMHPPYTRKIDVHLHPSFDDHLIPWDAKNIKQTELWSRYITGRIHGHLLKTPKGAWKLMELFRQHKIKNILIYIKQL